MWCSIETGRYTKNNVPLENTLAYFRFRKGITKIANIDLILLKKNSSGLNWKFVNICFMHSVPFQQWTTIKESKFSGAISRRVQWRVIFLSSICGLRNAGSTLLGSLTVRSSPWTSAFTAETINSIDTGSPIQTRVAQTFIDVFCTVDTSPTWITLTKIARDCVLRRKTSVT